MNQPARAADIEAQELIAENRIATVIPGIGGTTSYIYDAEGRGQDVAIIPGPVYATGIVQAG